MADAFVRLQSDQVGLKYPTQAACRPHPTASIGPGGIEMRGVGHKGGASHQPQSDQVELKSAKSVAETALENASIGLGGIEMVVDSR